MSFAGHIQSNKPELLAFWILHQPSPANAITSHLRFTPKVQGLKPTVSASIQPIAMC